MTIEVKGFTTHYTSGKSGSEEAKDAEERSNTDIFEVKRVRSLAQ
jgi:hypothetical protein